jgi:hypothetical protein
MSNCVVPSRHGISVVELATPEWVDWLDQRRPLESIGNVSPTGAEEGYYGH